MSAIGFGIDTTFDDTSVAILRGKREILVNLTLSQFKDHEEFGGVVPEIAARAHLKYLPILLKKTITQAKIKFEKLIELFVVTYV